MPPCRQRERMFPTVPSTAPAGGGEYLDFQMRLRGKQIAVAIVVLFVALQLVPVDRRNPSVDPAQTIYAITPVPPGVRSVFDGSCNDCHSNETRWPWYAHVSPASWIVAHDVHKGRREMNFSEWGTYSPKKREDKLEEICEQVENGDMPEGKYAFLRPKSKPTEAQRDAVCKWTEDARQ
jgi:Haem-binding domain